MCGIAGVFDTFGRGRIDPSLVERMVRSLGHRGPDDSGRAVFENAALGFARLSLVDLEGGMQPIANEDGTVVLICNGEIYNYRELRGELVRRGHRFRTGSDSEVILHLYEEVGEDCVHRLNGQFSFAIYYTRSETLFAARDHFGIAPFFYTLVDGLFLFGSEIKAILEHPSVPKEVDLVGLDQILSFPGIISPRTMFRNIASLRSGHSIQLRRGGTPEQRQYWDLVYPPAGEGASHGSESRFVEELTDHLVRAVRYRLQADVPIGLYLSGGLDSSLVAAIAAELTPGERLQSFSIDFPEWVISEGRYQRLMAEKVNSLHSEVLFGNEEITSRLKRVVYHSETPLRETFNTAAHALSESVRARGIKAVLAGQGADELFAGYVGYRFDQMRRAAPRKLDLNEVLEARQRQRVWGDPSFFYESQHHALQGTKARLYAGHLDPREIDCLDFFVIDRERIRGTDVVHKRSYVDFKLRLSDHLLSGHGDRMTFANSVECRYPFLDQDLVEFARTIPPGLKLNNFKEKYILKRTAERYLPAEIISREKFGFTAPGSPELLKQNDEYIGDLLSYSRIKREGYFDPDTVEALKKEYSRPGFRINVPYDQDLLIVVITFGMFLDAFDMPSLG